MGRQLVTGFDHQLSQLPTFGKGSRLLPGEHTSRLADNLLRLDQIKEVAFSRHDRAVTAAHCFPDILRLAGSPGDNELVNQGAF
jgi:hypothetical protein